MNIPQLTLIIGLLIGFIIGFVWGATLASQKQGTTRE